MGKFWKMVFFSLTLPSKNCTQFYHKGCSLVSFKHARSSIEIFGSKLTDDWKLGFWPGFDKHLGLSSMLMEIWSWKTIRKYQFCLSQPAKWGIFQGSISFGGVNRQPSIQPASHSRNNEKNPPNQKQKVHQETSSSATTSFQSLKNWGQGMRFQYTTCFDLNDKKSSSSKFQGVLRRWNGRRFLFFPVW